MAFVKKNYRELVDDILTQLGKGVVREQYDAELGRVKYRLAESPVKEIVKVEGILRGNTHIFQPSTDYKLSGGTLEWLTSGERPDDNTPFFANYSFGEPAGITDANPGSVTRTIVESIAREMDFFYAEMEQVYNSAFIDTASGKALDLVVSILGISRLPPQPATGTITFGRETDPEDVTIDAEAHLYDGRPKFDLKNPPVKAVRKVEGNAGEKRRTFIEGEDYKLEGNTLVWLEDGSRPDQGSHFTVDYVSFERITIPAETRVSTYSKQPENVREFVTVREGSLERLSDGRWEARIPVKAAKPGKVGNAPGGSITVMPHPPVGVEYVINREEIVTGTDAEGDEELRSRAKRALEAAGKATLTSLESAIRRVEGVKTLRIEDTPDGVPGIVRAVVDGGDETEIQKAIDNTRSAGIRIEFLRPKIAQIDLTGTVLVKRGTAPASVQGAVESKIKDYISSLQIGDEVVFSRVVKAMLDVDAVYDISDLTMTAYCEGLEPIVSTEKNTSMRTDERASARTISISVKGREIEVTE